MAAHYVRHDGTRVENIAKKYEGFVPVVNGDFGMFCELEILFLRAEPIGKVVKRDAAGGDIDNRMKVLLDALCIPQRGALPQEDDASPTPKPCFVLLSDDSLITSLKITADRLLTTKTDERSEAYVVISVNAKIVDPMNAPYGVQG